ncbi:hypothetical protein N2W42_001437 [Clostridium perfringens]|uniref:hypothetical protein n=1 Tax=Clostridium perfringens TaxID=1502 RepID=UPI002051AFBD|nr:hypothetical protein [Clostridium perfringens]EJT6340683.1 hypothetical protein [Clostridium perfringens]CAJ1611063.1 hypothetical protein CLO5623_02545 [Clostridium perfringens]DAO46944.1 MAG TPA: hypothetical protein [Bacteriophage sp.]
MDEKSTNESDALVKIYDFTIDEVGNIHKELVKEIPTKEERKVRGRYLEECRLKEVRKEQILDKAQLIFSLIGFIFSLLALLSFI